jgi:thioredoxin-like negative regulator of GroEL
VLSRELPGCLASLATLAELYAAGRTVVLGQTAQSLGAGWEKNKAVVLGDLAKAFIYQGDPEQAAAVLHQSIDLVERTRSAAGLRRVFKAGWQLRPWRHEPFVQDVQDRLLALGCAVPPQ